MTQLSTDNDNDSSNSVIVASSQQPQNETNVKKGKKGKKGEKNIGHGTLRSIMRRLFAVECS